MSKDTIELKPAVKGTLLLLATGRAVVEISFAGKCGYLDSFEGKLVRDDEHAPPHDKMLMPGVWRLYEAGYIDQFACVTPAGIAALHDHGIDAAALKEQQWRGS